MSRWSRHIVRLVSLLALSWTAAQDIQPTKPRLDFSDDPCGSPLVESQLWYSIDGRVVSVEDGGTAQIIMTKGHRRLTVRFVGIAVEQKGALADEAKGYISSEALNRNVSVWVNPDWLYQKKKPTEITGVVYLKDAAGDDLGLSLVTKGLARTVEPRPYTVSRYTFCKYREAESKAKSHKLGVWQ